MSPPPTPPSESQIIAGLPPEIKDGVIASILGGMAMTARILMSTEPVSFGFVLRRFLAASITAALVGLGTKDYFHSTGLWLAVSGGSGYAAPEVTDYLLRWVKAKGEAEIKKANPRGKAKTKSGPKRR